MTYASGTHPASTTARSTFATTLTSAGFTRVTQDYVPAATYLLDVWKSPAASNAAGTDWYLFLLEQVSGSTRFISMTVAEGWDDSTKLATKYIPVSNNVAPAADYSVGNTGIAPTAANLYYMSMGSWTDTSGTSYKITATVDRVIAAFVANSPTSHIYAGHADRFVPVLYEPVQPLVCLRLGDTSTHNQTNDTAQGGGTREPGVTTSSLNNWRVALGNSSNDNLYAILTENISGTVILSPLVPKAVRSSPPYRCILKGVRGTGSTGASTDVATETLADGSTITYWNANAASTQRFIPQV